LTIRPKLERQEGATKMNLDRMMEAVLLASLSAPAWGAPAKDDALVERALPADVAEAVETNYRIGRSEWDSGGIARVRTFSLAAFADLGAGTPAWLDAVVRELVVATRDDGPSALALTCGLDIYGDGEPVSEPALCARWHLEQSGALSGTNGGGARTRRDLEMLWSGGTSDEVQSYNRALGVVLAYVLPGPAAVVEIQSATNYFSVDVVTSVLLDAAAGTAQVVTFDWGA
jgi:hypothetical protein